MAEPKVVNAINTPWPVTVEVHFDSVLLADDNLTNPDNYTFTHGAYATSVDHIDTNMVRLTVENLFEFDSFTVTVSSNIKNQSGQGVDISANSYSFPISTRPQPSDMYQSLSAHNGRLKSGTVVVAIDSDADKWYIQTESGVDVVDKVSLSNQGFILDGYGYNTIHIG